MNNIFDVNKIKVPLKVSFSYCFKFNRNLSKILCLAVILCACLNDLISQTTSNRVTKSIYLVSDTIIEATYTISPSSVSLISQNDLNYTPDVVNNKLFITYQNQPDSISINFRQLSINLGYNQAAIDSSRITTDERVIPIETDYRQETINDRLLIDSKKLEYTGSFSRGVSFGNTQDVVLNSNFNMQMRGDLGNGLFIRAAISDENIPIQPEGNTQVLQEFDKVFMEVKKDKTTVIAGDYELARPDSYFINYYKKLKGISVSNTSASKKWQIENKGSFAISRGKFRRQQLEVQDGNQGPYKLQGEDGELFLQVLSGTEKVYSDGQLLKRGENEDYIIDYNRGEIRFTPNSIITANRRIIVEFEYAVQSYLRSLYAAESKFKHKKLELGFNFYNEQDSKTLSSNIQLDSTDLANLNAQGDNDIFRNGIFLPDENARQNLVLYTLDNNGILNYTAEDTTDVVGAVFSNFGNANGSYIIDTETKANGRVYKYVGEGQGSYLPQIPLVAPEKRQMTSLNAKYSLSDSTYVFIETAMSNNDKNRFSEIGNDDNIGLSLYTEIHDERSISKKHNLTLESQINFESSQKEFVALNPYRNPEFIRDWNIESNTIKNDQQIIKANFNLKQKKNNLKYSLSQFSDRFIYKGTRHIGEFRTLFKGLQVELIGNWMNSTNSLLGEEITFFRPRINASQAIFSDKWRLGFNFEKEENIRTFVQIDSLNALSFDYEYSRIYLENKTSDNFSFLFGVSQRLDEEVLSSNNTLTPSTTSTNIEFGGNWFEQQASQLTWKFVLRNFQVNEAFEEVKNANKAFIGTLDHKLNLFKNGLSLNTYYESNSGQEPKIEFQFIQVQMGEGSYIWNDYNQDSIQQINEFEISPFSDQASFEKITVFNNEFISTNRNILNQSLKVNPSKFIVNKNHFLNRWQINSRYRIDQKSLNDSNGSLFKFINFDLNAEGFVAFNSSFDHSLFFNRGNSKFDGQLSYRILNNKLLQISGNDQRSVKTYYTRSRLNLEKKFDALLESNIGSKQRTFEGSEAQNFDINFWNIIPQLNYRPNTKLRLVVKYKYENNQNVLGLENESAAIHDGGLDLTWRQDENSNLQFKFNYVLIDFTGAPNSPIEFEMLQGLKNGQNILWNLNYTRRISSSIDMIINYNGRKSEGGRLVNNAGVQMRAVF